MAAIGVASGFYTPRNGSLAAEVESGFSGPGVWGFGHDIHV
jgi:hypothetical protein